jgi:type III restriction enzyme
MGVDLSKQLWQHLKGQGPDRRTRQGAGQLAQGVKDGSVEVPEAFASAKQSILLLLHKLAGKLDIKDANKRETVKLRREVFFSPEFKELWDRIKHRTTYRVQFDNALLIQRCCDTMPKAAHRRASHPHAPAFSHSDGADHAGRRKHQGDGQVELRLDDRGDIPLPT